MSRWTTKLQKDITHEQTMSQCLNSYLTKIQTFISEKTTFVSAAVLKSMRNLLSILDSYQNCFQCLRLKLTHKIFRQIAIGKMSLLNENNQSFSGEYYLSDYIQKIGNFSVDTIATCFQSEGYHDVWNGDDTFLTNNVSVKTLRRTGASLTGTKYRYEFEFSPVNGFLSSPDLLMTNCELKLSFDRASVKHALIRLDESGILNDIEIKDCYALTEYISSGNIQNFFEKIQNEPIVYEYEDTEVVIKTLPTDDTTIRIDNIRGGNTPRYLFAGVIPSSHLQGDWSKSSTKFGQNDVTEFNISLNGNPVNGYPMIIKPNSLCYTMSQFNSVTSRHYNVYAGRQLSMQEFKYNFIWSHKFEAESTSSGWIGIDIKLSKAFNEPMSLVIWIINPTAITIDQFHQIEKINL